MRLGGPEQTPCESWPCRESLRRVGDVAFAVEDVEGRKGTNMPVLLRAAMPKQYWVVDLVLQDECVDRCEVFITEHDGDHVYTIFVGRLNRRDRAGFGTTHCAPGGPEHKNCRFAVQRCGGNELRSISCGQLEVGRSSTRMNVRFGLVG